MPVHFQYIYVMELLNSEEVKKCLYQTDVRKYSQLIGSMEAGTALRINQNEFNKRTPIPYYFLKYNRNGKKVVSVRKIGPKDYLVIKL